MYVRVRLQKPAIDRIALYVLNWPSMFIFITVQLILYRLQLYQLMVGNGDTVV